VAKRKRRELQHLRQEPSRRKNYQLGGTTTSDIYKPGFPMNLLSNVKFFAIIGVVVAVLMVVGALLTTAGGNDEGDPDDLPTPTPVASVTADASATASTTPAAKTFEKAETVIDAAAKTYTATVKTNKGDFVIELYADKAPNTVNSFVFLAQEGFFNSVTFHRVIDGFVIQAGDPTATGGGGPGYQTADEPNQERNLKYTLSMAKVGGQSVFGSQFFINLKDNPSLDYDNPTVNKYYPFGKVVSGTDVVDAIGKVKTGAGDKPVEAVVITGVEITEKAK
jgi:cyclophilin family peptidyl-prolyl cis-trans isomerase